MANNQNNPVANLEKVGKFSERVTGSFTQLIGSGLDDGVYLVACTKFTVWKNNTSQTGKLCYRIGARRRRTDVCRVYEFYIQECECLPPHAIVPDRPQATISAGCDWWDPWMTIVDLRRKPDVELRNWLQSSSRQIFSDMIATSVTRELL